MTTVRLGAASLNQTPVDWVGNRERIVAAIDAARSAGVGLLCLPELCVSGYGCEDLFFADHTRQRALDELEALRPATAGVAVTVGLPLAIDGRLYNAAAMLADGRLLGFALKQHLAGDGLHYEPRWFSPWPAGEVATVDGPAGAAPAGDLVFDLAGVRVGFEICRDGWVDDRPARRLGERGVGVVLNPSASHFAFGKQAIRKRLAVEGASALGGVIAYCNLLGNESGRSIYDGGVLIAGGTGAGQARILAEGPRFSFEDHTLTHADVEIPNGRAAKGEGVVRDAFSVASRAPAAERASVAVDAWESGPSLKHEEFARAVPLGLFDYLRKSGAGGFVLSLSGGADSAATAMMVALMARQATDELGAERLAGRLPNVEGLADIAQPDRVVRKLLLTLYQATRNSSETTRDASERIARAIGAEHHAWGVDALVDRYVELAEGVLGRPLDWDRDDVALQNIQSRARSPGVWLLANLRGALLLTTGNRSEASVGYATMDGDTSGGLAPLAGVDKAYLLEWLRWMHSVGPTGFGPTPALDAINAQQPTAELRPPGAGQTDEADLMPYAVLDAIERSAIGELRTPEQTVAALRERFPEQTPDQLAAWVERFHRLWRASQWKRERLAPSFHLDTIGVDPRTWRRWPILSG